jgi:outer membrane protein assembly factor BamB
MWRFSRGLSFVALVAACSDTGPPPGEAQPVLKWRNADVRGESIPVVDGSAVYHLEQETHILSAVRKSDGSLIWKRTLPVTNPAFDGYGLALSSGVLVVGDLDLFGIDPASGSILWKYQQSEGKNPGFQRLTVSNGVIYCGSTSGHVFAVDAATGVERWVARAMPATSSIYSPIQVDGIVYAGFTDFAPGSPNRGGSVAINASTGALIWSVFAPIPSSNTPTDNTYGVVVFGDKAFFGSTTGVHVIDRTTERFCQRLGRSSSETLC